MRDVDAIIKRTISLEGGNKVTDIANDAGGLTKYGISKRSFPSVDIANLTETAAIDIYRREFYDRMKLELIDNNAVAAKMFDMGVNMGTGTAIKLAQKAVGTTVDGVNGPATAALINAMPEQQMINALRQNQLKHYADIVKRTPSQIEFFVGWINRAFA